VSGFPVAAARYAGARVARVEDPRLLTGQGTFVDDVTRPGMLHACFVRSPVARARISSIDVSGALRLAGVHAVFTAADLNPRVREQWYSLHGPDVPDTPRPPLADGEVRFVGDPVALVVAADRYLAEDAAELVVVDYEPLPPVVDYVTAQESDELVHPGYPGNLAGELNIPPSPEAAAVFDEAPHVMRETIYQQGYAAVPMETRGLIAEWSAPSGELTIWASTQSPHEVRMFSARLLGIPAQRVRVVARDTGGGFGQKVVPQREDMCVLLAARQVPAALKWIEDRRENLLSAGQSRHEHADARMAFDGDGRILAAAIDYVQDVGAYPVPWPTQTAAVVGMLFTGPYRVPRGGFTAKCVFSNTAGRTAYRGPWQFESVAREVLLDIAAREMGIDPAELRRRNLLRRDELPYTNPNGMPTSRSRRSRRSSRRWRSPATRHSGKSRKRPAPPGATSASARAPTSSRPLGRSGSTPRRARRSASSRPARSACMSRAGPAGTAWKPPWSSSPRTRSAWTSATSAPFRATRRSRPTVAALVAAARDR
jgi:aerobic carbon-monoxide dehydrogenase large subunit